MSILRRSLLGLMAIVAMGCASTATPSADRSGRPDQITEAQLTPYNGQTIEYAIRRLRPEFLRTRGPISATQADPGVVVYLGGTRMGGIGTLAQIAAGDIRSVQYLSPADASRRFGLDHTSGAIVLEQK